MTLELMTTIEGAVGPQAHPDELMLAFKTLLDDRRAALKTRARFLISLLEGDSYVVDPSNGSIVREGWIEDPDVLVLTNAATLSDMMAGRFDPEKPTSRHLFLWAGADEALDSLRSALGGAASWLDVRAGRGRTDG